MTRPQLKLLGLAIVERVVRDLEVSTERSDAVNWLWNEDDLVLTAERNWVLEASGIDLDGLRRRAATILNNETEE